MEAPSSLTVLQIEGLRKSYVQGKWWEGRYRVDALNGVDLCLQKGETLAIVGESGSGKTTLALCAAMLLRADAGRIWIDRQEIGSLSRTDIRRIRPKAQIIFQDSAAALPHRLSAAEIIAEPMAIQGGLSRAERRMRALELMSIVGVSPDWGHRLPYQFSGGQRQRIAIARALSLKPKLLILDEPFVGLDLSAIAQIVNVLMELQSRFSIAYLCISHDLELMHAFADRIVQMKKGKILNEADQGSITDEESVVEQVRFANGLDAPSRPNGLMSIC